MKKIVFCVLSSRHRINPIIKFNLPKVGTIPNRKLYPLSNVNTYINVITVGHFVGRPHKWSFCCIILYFKMFNTQKNRKYLHI